MSPGTLQGRRSLDVVFGLFHASRVTVGAYCLWAVADWIHSQGLRPLLPRCVFIRTHPFGVVGRRRSHLHGVQESGRTPRGGADHRPLGVVASRDWY